MSALDRNRIIMLTAELAQINIFIKDELFPLIGLPRQVANGRILQNLYEIRSALQELRFNIDQYNELLQENNNELQNMCINTEQNLQNTEHFLTLINPDIFD